MNIKIYFITLLLFSPLTLAQNGTQSPGFSGFIPLILLLLVFYFLLIRPQQKRAKSHKLLLTDLNKGDEVLTNGGIVAKIIAVDETDNFVTLEISKGVAVKVQKQSINQRMPKGTV